jgi:hypothetical protein
MESAASRARGVIVKFLGGQKKQMTIVVCLLGLVCGACVPGFEEVNPRDPENDWDGDGFTEFAGDCDDANPSINPDESEICNGMDDDCDGSIPPTETDDDGDTFNECADGDCDDSSAAVFPDGLEIPDDSIDQDCSGTDTVTCFENLDGDGYGSEIVLLAVDGDCTSPGESPQTGDCDDADPLVFPGQAEVCNGTDDSCAGSLATNEADEDDDGEMACSGDCDDADPLVVSGLPACPIDGDGLASCGEIRDSGLPIRSGVYTIDPAGTGSPSAVYCDQLTRGGGWMLVVNLFEAGWDFIAESEAAGTPSLEVNYSLDISQPEYVVEARMVRWGPDLVFDDAGATTRKFELAHGAFRFGQTQAEASNLGAAAGCRHYYIAESSTDCYQLSDGNCFDVALAGREREDQGWCNSGWNGPLAMFIRD